MKRLSTTHLRFLLVALPLLLAVSAAGPRSCPIDVQCGDVLDIDHGQYRLNGDLECPDNPSGAAVTITGERVHLNLKGYTITRDDDSGQFLREGIAVSGANAHIHNGSIVDINCPIVAIGSEDCSGILLSGDAHGARINGMSLHNNTNGVYAAEQASGVRIHGSDITGNLRVGIRLHGAADGAKITGNDVSDTGGFTWPDGTPSGGWGYSGSVDDVALIGNVANNCARIGIILNSGGGVEQFAERNTIRDNETLNNGIFGISVTGLTEAVRSRDNLIQGNASFGSGSGLDLREGIGGPAIPPAVNCLNTWKDNDFDFAQPDCIE
jgi:hypothetical protein